MVVDGGGGGGGRVLYSQLSMQEHYSSCRWWRWFWNQVVNHADNGGNSSFSRQLERQFLECNWW